MKQFYLFIVFLLFFSLKINAQPPICGPNPSMTANCASACIICDIDGFTGINDSPSIGIAPPGFCAGQIHNIQWIGFIAGSVDLTLDITVSNCNQGEGLQIGIWQSYDCINYTSVSNCEQQVSNFSTASFSNTEPLVPGEYYYLVIDGAFGDICNYSVAVTEGTTLVPGLFVPTVIDDNDDYICIDESVTFTAAEVDGATDYEWSLDNVPVGNGLSHTTSFGAPGVYNLCITPSNVCSTAPPTCELIIIEPTIPSQRQEELCIGECLEIDGQQFCAAGGYELTYTDQNGCDSTVFLTILPLFSDVALIDEEICQGETYDFYGQAITEAGEYQQVFTNQFGCDSTFLLNLTIAAAPTTSEVGEICEGESYEVGSESFSTTGTYNIVVPDPSGGCGEVIELDLTVVPTAEAYLTEVICEGDSFAVGTEDFDETGMYQITLVSDANCDSIVYLDLSVNTVQTTNLVASICNGESYEVGSESFDSTGDFTINLNDENGCDSIVELSLTVVDVLEETVVVAICEGETYEIEGETFNTSGDYAIELQATNGCDSLVNLELTVSPPVTENITAQICDGQSYQVGTESFSETGQYDITLTSINTGCDSIVTLDLEVTASLLENVSAEICDGQAYQVGSESFNNTGNYQVNLTSVAGCDSIVDLDLTVLTTLTSNTTAEICEGETYQVGTESFNTDGVFDVVLTSSGGCDSIVTLSLSVLAPVTSTLNAEICNGEIYEIESESFSTAGTYSIPLTSVQGCDSILTLILDVTEAVTESVTAQICEGASYFVGTEEFMQSGVYDVTLQTATGCDSIVSLDLAVLTALTENIVADICADESYEVGTEVFDNTGNYTINLISSTGCDSIVNLSLNVFDDLSEDLEIVICDGESYFVGAEEFSTAGQYAITLQSLNTGCDSLVNLDLSFVSLIEEDVFAQICNGQSYTVGSEEFTTAGNYAIPLTAANGCDSLVNLSLTVQDVIVENIVAEICEGESYEVNGLPYTTTGDYAVDLTAIGGCDSLVNLSLTVNPLLTQIEEGFICEGEEYLVGNEIFTETGNYQIALNAQSGCDSTVFLDLIVYENNETVLNEAICEGESVEVGTQIFTQTGDYIVDLLNENGCDSTVLLYLNVAPVESTTINAAICQGEAYEVGTETFAETGNYTISLLTSNSCDSTVFLNLTVNEPNTSLLTETICSDEEITVGGQVFNTSGEYEVLLQNQFNCDSLVQLDLTVVACGISGTESVTPVSCNGETDGSFVFSMSQGNAPFSYAWAGNGYNGEGTLNALAETVIADNISAGSYTMSVVDAEGLEYNLTINVPGPEPITAIMEASDFGLFNISCYGANDGQISVTPNGGNPPYTYTWSNGATGSTLTNLSSGMYELTINDSNNCSVVYSQSLTAPTEIVYEINKRDADCLSEKGAIEITAISGGAAPYVFLLDDNPATQNTVFEGLAAGTYELQIEDANGCTTPLEEVSLLDPPELRVDIDSIESISLGDSLLLDPMIWFDYDSLVWTGDNLSCYDCEQPYAQPTQTSLYTLTAYNAEGCSESLQFIVPVNKGYQIFVPTVFNPEGAANSRLFIQSGENVELVKSFVVFSRWGEPVHSIFDFPTNDPIFGWDGNFRGDRMDTGVFVWTAEVQFTDGHVEIFSGDATLLR